MSSEMFTREMLTFYKDIYCKILSKWIDQILPANIAFIRNCWQHVKNDPTVIYPNEIRFYTLTLMQRQHKENTNTLKKALSSHQAGAALISRGNNKSATQTSSSSSGTAPAEIWNSVVDWMTDFDQLFDFILENTRPYLTQAISENGVSVDACQQLFDSEASKSEQKKQKDKPATVAVALGQSKSSSSSDQEKLWNSFALFVILMCIRGQSVLSLFATQQLCGFMKIKLSI
jgi:hypothetical protein